MKRLLCILSNMNAGGAETFLMKIYRQIDRSLYQMDFCINVKEKCFYEDEILSMGGKIYRIPTKSESVKVFTQELSNIIRENGYQYVLRITSNAAGFLDLKIAKKAGVKICAARSSNSSDGGSKAAFIIHKISQLLYEKYVDVKIAPSDLAAGYTFRDKRNVQILHNALDLNLFRYSAEGRSRIREEYGFTAGDIVIGHVGRFMTQKNHEYLFRVFSELYKTNHHYKLLLIGKGELEGILRYKVKDLDLEGAVVFGGVRSDIPNVLSAMDIFVFPSLYEGMPNTVIEAQATGLPCIISDRITREADITGLVTYLPLKNEKLWSDCIKTKTVSKNRDGMDKMLREKGYDIQSETQRFINLMFTE